MLPGELIADAVRRGLGLAGRGAGTWYDLYRARSTERPIDPANRVMRLPAAFGAPGSSGSSVGYGKAEWHGVFDAAYSQVGDYLCGQEGIFFIAAQPRFGPLLCIRTNRVLSFMRTALPRSAGLQHYGGVQTKQMETLLKEWPASALTSLREGGRGQLPADAPGVNGSAGGWEVLLPALPGVLLRPGDLARDDLGRVAVVGSAELTGLGWRLSMRQAMS